MSGETRPNNNVHASKTSNHIPKQNALSFLHFQIQSCQKVTLDVRPLFVTPPPPFFECMMVSPDIRFLVLVQSRVSLTLARLAHIHKLKNVPFISNVRIETGPRVVSNHGISQYRNNTYRIFLKQGFGPVV